MNEAEWLASTDPAKMLRFVTENPDHQSITCCRSDRKLRLFACTVARASGRGRDSACLVEECVEAGQPNHNFSDTDAIDRGEFWRRCRSVDAAHGAAHAYRGQQTSNLLRDIVGNPFRPLTLPRGPTEARCDRCGRINPTVSFADMRCLKCGCGIARVQPGPCPWITPTVFSLAQACYSEQPGRECERCNGQGGWGGGRKRAAGLVDYNETRHTCSDCKGTGRIDDGIIDTVRLAVLADALEEAGCPQHVPCPKCMPNFETANGWGLGWLQGQDDRGYFNVGCTNCGGKGLLEGDGMVGTGRVLHPLLAHLRSPGLHYRGCWVVDLLLGKE